MQKRKIASILAAFTCISFLLNGCGEKETTAVKEAKEIVQDESSQTSTHEPITILSSFKNMSAFMDLVHEKYPEINLEVIPYSGANYSSYVQSQLETGDMPDIYSTKFYTSGQMDLGDKLLDMSGYDFMSNYSEARLKDVADDGAIYMIPTYYECIGIIYNKTLLRENGWTLPKSFKELRELATKVEEAGYQLALNQLEYPGYNFQYFCNILDTSFLNTIDGHAWQREFLKGNATIENTPEMMNAMKILDEWRELGMLNGNGNITNDAATKEIMAEGNTLFMLGSTAYFSHEELQDEFGLMPYLSEDGTQNAYILNISRYVGLNKHLEDPGNEQKLEDAIHVMDVLSTVEGMRVFNSYYSTNTLLPLKDYTAEPDNIYADIQEDLNAGYTAPYIYCGWENTIVANGEAMLSYITGESDLEQLIKEIDENQSLIWDNSEKVFSTITEKIANTDCAKLVGICFAKASGADLALISTNKWYKMENGEDLNLEGVSGELYPVPVTDEVITSIFPTGWHGNIENLTLTGKRIKELAETGYDRDGKEEIFPYVVVTPENFEIEDEKIYTVSVGRN